jgi:Tol biopolymer transport system component
MAGAVLAGGLATRLWFRQPQPPLLVSQFTVEAPPNTTFASPVAATAVSPDGRYVVFSAGRGSNPLLWLRPLDSLEARPLPGTEGANLPFWSPDSKSIGFFAGLKLKRLDLQGGAPITLCDTSPSFLTAVGGAWNRDGVILFGGRAGLHRISASGGEPVLLTKADDSRRETGHGFPQFLPDGKRFLYSVQSGDAGSAGIYIGSLDHPEEKVQVLKTYTKAVYTQPITAGAGFLLWMREQTLWAQRFDAGKLRLQSDPVPVVQDVQVNPNNHRAAFWASDGGLLVYRTGALREGRITWFNRDGTRGQQIEEGGNAPRLSRDGKKAVLRRTERIAGRVGSNLWLLEFSSSVLTRLTFGANAQDSNPSWSPDGRQIAFSSNRSGISQIYRKNADGGGQEEQLTSGPNDKLLTDWSRDGKLLLYFEQDPKRQSDLWALPLDGDRKPIPILQTPFIETKGQLSPDGKWIAYDSNEFGVFEVYVRSFPSSAAKWQISNGGGTNPRWRGDGKELFYLSPDNKMMAATVRISDTSVQADTPRELFTGVPNNPGLEFPYDVTADGQRFLSSQPPEGGTVIPPLTVLVNWDAGLKK